MEIKKGENRFYLVDEQKREAGEITWHLFEDHVWVIDRTYVSSDFRGQGIAGILLDTLADYARKEDIKLIPMCSYAEKQFKIKTEYQDIIY